MQTTNAQKLYAGADLHGSNVYLAILDQEGNSVFRRRVKTTIEAVNAALDPFWKQIVVLGVESTFNWYWFVDQLQEQGRNIKLGNPAKMAQYEGIKITNDMTDAQWLAEQLRLGVFPECYIYPKEIRPVRDALRRRQLFVRQRTQTILSMKGLIERHGIKPPSDTDVERWLRAGIDENGLEPFVQLQLNSLLSATKHSDCLAKNMEKEVLSLMKSTSQFHRVQQVPGIGMILGMTIALEAGDFGRFPSSGDFASYCRCVKSECISNGKKKGKNNTKNGNRYLAWAFIEAATCAARAYPNIHAWYERKKHRSMPVKAKKALACKLSKAVWHVMNGEEYNEKMLFG